MFITAVLSLSLRLKVRKLTIWRNSNPSGSCGLLWRAEPRVTLLIRPPLCLRSPLGPHCIQTASCRSLVMPHSAGCAVAPPFKHCCPTCCRVYLRMLLARFPCANDRFTAGPPLRSSGALRLVIHRNMTAVALTTMGCAPQVMI